MTCWNILNNWEKRFIMNRLCKNYSKMILKTFKELNPIIIFYGSNIYNESCSDLDVCLVFNENLNSEIKQKMIERTILFQKSFNLRIDEEIPFENKLIYTLDELQEVFTNSPFRDGENFKLDDIVKTAEFLSSSIMKKRLLINLLTTDHKVVNDKDNVIKKFEDMAWKEILLMLKNVFNTDLTCVDNVLDHLYVNPKTHYGGEMHLGYKLANPNKRKYLKNKVKKSCKLFNRHLDK